MAGAVVAEMAKMLKALITDSERRNLRQNERVEMS